MRAQSTVYLSLIFHNFKVSLTSLQSLSSKKKKKSLNNKLLLLPDLLEVVVEAALYLEAAFQGPLIKEKAQLYDLLKVEIAAAKVLSSCST